jgi:hypothetical protein
MKRVAPSPVLVGSLVAILGLYFTCLTARADGPSFRDIVRSHLASNKGSTKLTAEQSAALELPKDVDTLIALEYTFLLRRDGQETPVDPREYEFVVGDQIRVEISPLQDLYIYIFHKGASGEQTCLLPEVGKGEKAPMVKRGEKTRLPDDGSVFEFTTPPGQEELIVVATEKPSEDLDALHQAIFNPDNLTPESEAQLKNVKSKATERLKSLEKRLSNQVGFRGILTRDAIANATRKAVESDKEQLFFEEPPVEGEKSTLVTKVTRTGAAESDLYFTIPLRSTAGT